VRSCAPKTTERIAKPVSRVANLLLIGLVAMILATQYQTLAAIRLRGWFGMGLLLAASLGVGWICGGATASARKAMAVTTAVRNAAVALVIVTTNFADTPAVTVVVAYGLFSLLAALAFAILLGRPAHDASNAIRSPE
jgi:BASS family bile acid:Na+ symporter